jgi:hypothetical protein
MADLLKYRLQILLLPLLIALISCEPFTGSGSDPELPPADRLVWVMQVFSGGMQCGWASYTPPDTKKLLHSAGVFVYRAEVEYLGVCGACGCPAYAARHYALIHRRDLSKATQLGFNPTDQAVDL